MLTRHEIRPGVELLTATIPDDAELNKLRKAIDADEDNILVIHEEDITEAVEEAIGTSLFAFRPRFLAEVTELPEIVFSKLCDLCEDGNDAIFAILESTCGFSDFCREAVDNDGLGNFLSSYDGQTNEFEVDGECYYFFRE